MTDELVWERLAISIWQYHSLLPRLHGEVIKNLAQLYPALISPIFAGRRRPERPEERAHPRRVGDELRRDPGLPAREARHRAGAGPPTCSQSSAWRCRGSCTRRFSRPRSWPTRCSSGRCSAIHRSITSPRWSNDLVALVVIVLAFFARTQFALLAGVYPLAVVAADLGAPAERPMAQTLGRRADRLRAGAHHPRVLLRAVARSPRVVYRLHGRRPEPPQPLQQPSPRRRSPRRRPPDLRPATPPTSPSGWGSCRSSSASAWLLAGVVRPSARDANRARSRASGR